MASPNLVLHSTWSPSSPNFGHPPRNKPTLQSRKALLHRSQICRSSSSSPVQETIVNKDETGEYEKLGGFLPKTQNILSLPNTTSKEGIVPSRISVGLATQRMAAAFCNFAEQVVNAMEPPRPRKMDPAIQLADNFFPLPDESPPQPCLEVTGQIPECLNGVYVRNGPNPLFLPRAGYHYFDGDGMLHAVKIKDGKAIHACRFTRTNRYIQEKAAGQPLFTKALGELNGLAGLARLAILSLRNSFGLVDIEGGIGPANASIVFFNGRLLAMSEDDMPYAVRLTDDGDLCTVGRFNFSGDLTRTMTAHPKIDPVTGEMFSFTYNLLKQPYLEYFRVTPDGKKGKDIPITLTEPTIVHDFAITERYAVFSEHQMVFRLQEMFMGRSPIVCDANKVSRVGILPRYDDDESRMKWFDSPGCTCFHFLNAWEEGDEVVVVASVNAPTEVIFEEPEKLDCRLHEFRFNMKTGKSGKQQVSSANIDVGRINEKLIGRKARYVYMSTSGPWPKFSGVAKVDLEALRLPAGRSAAGVNTGEPCVVGWRKYGEGSYGSEPLFIPRRREAAEEDDGFVVSFVHNEADGQSELMVMDARSPTLEPVASIKMPCRVPYGFHGLFINDQQLQTQDLFPHL